MLYCFLLERQIPYHPFSSSHPFPSFFILLAMKRGRAGDVRQGPRGWPERGQNNGHIHTSISLAYAEPSTGVRKGVTVTPLL